MTSFHEFVAAVLSGQVSRVEYEDVYNGQCSRLKFATRDGKTYTLLPEVGVSTVDKSKAEARIGVYQETSQ